MWNSKIFVEYENSVIVENSSFVLLFLAFLGKFLKNNDYSFKIIVLKSVFFS